MGKANVHISKTTIPTYDVIEDNINPTFDPYNGIYIYPYKLQDVISKEKKDREYETVILENDYIVCTLLPELGGRLYSVKNKKDNVEWFYKNPVIKPALIGTRGAWFSGGVEYNFPVSHNPNTYDRVNYFIRHEDDYASVYFGNQEAISNMNWTIELRLYSNKSYLEQKVFLQNENLFPNRYYFWTNAAIKTSMDLEYFYPYDYAVGDRVKGYFKWPYDGEKRTEWDKNYKSALEFFGKNVNRPYFGAYDHKDERGIVHVSNPRQLRGAKIFSWGWGHDGRIWSDILSDDNSYYTEIQSGLFETQRIYELMDVFEEKEWSEQWYSISETNGYTYANSSGIIKLQEKDGKIETILMFVIPIKDGKFTIKMGNNAVYTQDINVDCNETIYILTHLPYDIKAGYTFEIRQASTNKNILYYQWQEDDSDSTDVDIDLNKDISFLNSKNHVKSPLVKAYEYLTLDWLHKAEEVLRSVTLNDCDELLLVKGIVKYKKRHYVEAKRIFTHVVCRNQHNDKARLYLCILYLKEGNLDKARDLVLDIDINSHYYSKANILLAIIETRRQRYNKVIHILSVERHINLLGKWIKAYSYRKLNMPLEAISELKDILDKNPLYLKAYWELYQNYLDLNEMKSAYNYRDGLIDIVRGDVKQYIDQAIEYKRIGAYEDARAILACCETNCGIEDRALFYHIAHLEGLVGNAVQENLYLQLAREANILTFSPSRHEEYDILLKYNNHLGEEEYFLGNMEMNYKNYDKALELWLVSEKKGFSHSTLFRNIAYYYINIRQNYEKALPYLKKGKDCGDKNIDILLLLNKAYKELGINRRDEKQDLLDWALTFKHDFAKRCSVDLYCQLGQYEEAVEVLINHKFDIWEHETDEDLKLDTIYHKAFEGLLGQSLLEKDYEKAKNCITYLLQYPDNVYIYYKNTEELERVKDRINGILDKHGVKDMII